MAELATIARPYAEALFDAAGADASALAAPLAALAALAADADLRQYAESPKVTSQQVFDLVAGLAAQQGYTLDAKLANLLQAAIENGRLSALPEIASQFHSLVNNAGGVSDALVQSAFPIDEGQLTGVVAALERRFGRKLNAQVELAPELIGGIRVVVGDEVLDTSVKARLDQMKAALTA
jgi:F-type H+-transporting ATPase subunit delta